MAKKKQKKSQVRIERGRKEVPMANLHLDLLAAPDGGVVVRGEGRIQGPLLKEAANFFPHVLATVLKPASPCGPCSGRIDAEFEDDPAQGGTSSSKGAKG